MDFTDTEFYIGENSPSDIPQKTISSKIIKKEIHKRPIRNLQKMKCKILNIYSVRGHPCFHFEINGNIYTYGTRGVRADFKIRLYCSKKICSNLSFISPSGKGKGFIRNTPKDQKSKFPKFIDKMDPRVYDIDSYDINSFEIYGTHRCPGTELKNKLHENKKSTVKSSSVEIAECIEKTEPNFIDD